LGIVGLRTVLNSPRGERHALNGLDDWEEKAGKAFNKRPFIIERGKPKKTRIADKNEKKKEGLRLYRAHKAPPRPGKGGGGLVKVTTR